MHTSIGKLLDFVRYGAPDEYTFRTYTEKDLRTTIVTVVSDCAHYVADEKICHLIGESKVQDGLKAMVQAGIRQLPHDPILVEFRDPGRRIPAVVFVRLSSKPLWPTPKFKDNFRGDLYCYPVAMSPDQRYAPGDSYIMATVDPVDPVVVDWSDDPKKPYTVYIGNSPDQDGMMKEDLGLDVAEAMSIAMLMLNTKGVVTERVETRKLNKARAKGSNPKPPINEYSVIKIGHIYDKAGNAHAIGGTGRHMKVHWRAGHVRQQRIGTRAIPREQRPTKMVFVPACLVNFDPAEGAAPLPKHEVKV